MKTHALVLLVLVAAACRGTEPESPVQEVTSAETRVTSALDVRIAPKSGSRMSGRATFREVPEGVQVVVHVSGLTPGPHGVHIHERSDCSAPDATSAGEHYSPDRHPHGLPPTTPRHLGDFGNIQVQEDGRGHLEILAAGANLRPNDPHSFLDRAIVVHADRDTGEQPSGNSGARVGCGEIRR